MTADVPVLAAQDLNRTYRGRRSGDATVTALDGVSVQVRRGEVCAVVGESGSGKTTLGRHLLGTERPDSGVVRFEGSDIRTLDRAGRRTFRKSIQVVLQDPASSLNPRMKVGAIIAEPMRAVRAFPRDEFADRIVDSLAKVGLPADSITRYPHQFSGGQRQRIAIARAVAVSPSVVIMDEPVSSLDVAVAARVLDLIVHLRDELGIGLMLISHNLGHVWRIAQEVAVMRHGRIVEQGPVAEVFARPSHEYTKALLDAVPRMRHQTQPSRTGGSQ